MQKTESVKSISIPFEGLSYLYIIDKVIHWNTEGHYNKVILTNGVEKDKRFFSSQKGSLNLNYIQSVTLNFDSSTEEFCVNVFFSGNNVFFTTKSPLEAENLYNIIHLEHYGFSLEDMNSFSEAKVPFPSGTGSDSLGTITSQS